MFCDYCGNLKKPSPGTRCHFVDYVNHTARPQVGIERHLEHWLTSARELVRKDVASAGIRVSVGIVENDDSVGQERPHALVMEVLKGLSSRRCAVDPWRRHNDQRIQVA
jgi:hypothetical protein